MESNVWLALIAALPLTITAVAALVAARRSGAAVSQGIAAETASYQARDASTAAAQSSANDLTAIKWMLIDHIGNHAIHDEKRR